MPPEGSSAEDVSSLATQVRAAIELRYEESGAARYDIKQAAFGHYVAAVVARYGTEFGNAERVALVQSLRLEELVLARACSAGNDVAWGDFLARFRDEMYRAAVQITRDEATGRELADGLYAELYGLPNQDGRRISKLNYYMGRGSLAGWLRTVLAQRHVDRCRSQARDVSLDEQLESGVAFAAKADNSELYPDDRVAEAVGKTLAELNSEDRLLLASYYLDRQTLAAIGRQLGVHESTVSRKLEKLTGTIRKRIHKRLRSNGMDERRCAEILQEIDVRDLNINVERNLRQEKKTATF